ncbi:hypothetical protein A7K93_03010 [Candidatus Methylacidiphilum fumarolicum]|nr:hypothetical protein A7K73_00505 [Candidatus Methylacidiphilum fumarolicum]TFE74898.1 hypothetical protein A7K93_03010 [Candidatus Methylacidiphilum fumarolicum]TFE75544.1 hypothetical protein A7K72_01800 [Candidatus Methylacidiphilum fumarolicum]TFE77946.1 hypothetical protein A7D33_00040 [Candidatus Methylacidiphilum fumarolicum]
MLREKIHLKRHFFISFFPFQSSVLYSGKLQEKRSAFSTTHKKRTKLAQSFNILQPSCSSCFFKAWA